jgi:hypothetical protein
MNADTYTCEGFTSPVTIKFGFWWKRLDCKHHDRHVEMWLRAASQPCSKMRSPSSRTPPHGCSRLFMRSTSPTPSPMKPTVNIQNYLRFLPEIYSGAYSWSYLLEMTWKTTYAGDEHPGPGPLEHHQIPCLNHVIDVITTRPPRMAVIDRMASEDSSDAVN